MDRLQNVLKSQTNNKKQTEMCHAMSYWLQVCEMRHLENKHSTYIDHVKCWACVSVILRTFLFTFIQYPKSSQVEAPLFIVLALYSSDCLVTG